MTNSFKITAKDLPNHKPDVVVIYNNRFYRVIDTIEILPHFMCIELYDLKDKRVLYKYVELLEEIEVVSGKAVDILFKF